MLPMMPLVNGAKSFGSWKLLGSIGYHRFGSAVEPTSDGLAPDGSHRASCVAFSIWQRNRTPPVGVPFGYPTGFAVKPQLGDMPEPEKICAVPMMRQPSTTCLRNSIAGLDGRNVVTEVRVEGMRTVGRRRGRAACLPGSPASVRVSASSVNC